MTGAGAERGLADAGGLPRGCRRALPIREEEPGDVPDPEPGRTDNGVSVADPGREGAAISNKEGLLDAALMGRLALSTGVVNGDRAGPLRGPRPPGE